MFSHIPRVKQFETSPEAEVKGAVMLGWMSETIVQYTRPRLAAKGIYEIDAETWYPYQAFLDVTRDIIMSNEAVSQLLISVGRNSAWRIPLHDFASMNDFKIFVEGMYENGVRNKPDYEASMVLLHEGQHYLFNNTPNANDLYYGWYWEILRRAKIGGIKYGLTPYQYYPSVEFSSIFLLEALE